MSSLEGKLSQSGDVVLLTQAGSYLAALNLKMQEAIGERLNIVKGYLSKYEVADELRLTLRDEYRNAPPAGVQASDFVTIKPLLDKAKPMTEIASTEADFNKLEDYLNKVATNAKGAFEPTIGNTFSAQNQTIYPIPQATDKDPRRYGRLLQFNKFSPAVKKWLINNSLLYGFVLYEDYGLYYIGLKEVQSKTNTDTAVQSLVNKFQRTPIPAGEIRITAQQVQQAKDPVSGDLEVALLSAPVANNDGQSFTELFIVPGGTQTALKEAATAAWAMYAAAKAAGVTLSVGSGFRPAAGPTVTWRSASGKSGQLTTQEAIRRSENRFVKSSSDYIKYIINNGNANGKWGQKQGKEAFIWYAGSSAYTAATAPPGSSNHGSGIALDFNTGTRDRSTGFSDLNPNVYVWLAKNAHKFGFIRAVSSEEWHWEYRPTEAVRGPYARVAPGGGGKLANNGWYVDLGLDKLTA